MSSTKGKNASKTQDGIFVYIGPSLRGVIQNGSIYRGTKAEVLSKLTNAIDKYPKIIPLVVPAADLAEAREKIKQTNNTLGIAYKAMLESN